MNIDGGRGKGISLFLEFINGISNSSKDLTGSAFPDTHLAETAGVVVGAGVMTPSNIGKPQTNSKFPLSSFLIDIKTHRWRCGFFCRSFFFGVGLNGRHRFGL